METQSTERAPQTTNPSTSQSTLPLNGPKIKERPQCSFGKSCYRKNPQHKNDEAHPGDDDYKVIQLTFTYPNLTNRPIFNKHCFYYTLNPILFTEYK